MLASQNYPVRGQNSLELAEENSSLNSPHLRSRLDFLFKNRANELQEQYSRISMSGEKDERFSPSRKQAQQDQEALQPYQSNNDYDNHMSIKFASVPISEDSQSDNKRVTNRLSSVKHDTSSQDPSKR